MLAILEELYKKYNRREFVHPDPLEFLYDYPEIKDREIVGLIASSLAYGRVRQILKSVEMVLKKVGNRPFDFLKETPVREMEKIFKGFRHRFTDGSDVAGLLAGAKSAVEKHGSLERFFLSGVKAGDENYMCALESFVLFFPRTQLLPLPAKGSACKRLNLFLRWMVRRDKVDPGGWKNLDSAKLVVPLDTHMYKVGTKFGFTKRGQADLKTAIEITRAFSRYAPNDPVKYDFALTRPGIRGEAD